MFNVLRSLILLNIAALIITACGDSDTSSSSTETAPTTTAETQPSATDSTQQSLANESMPEPETTSSAEPTPAAATTTETTATDTTASTEPVDGGNIYHTYCKICHQAGMNAAPKYGSKPLWAKRIAQGRDTVYSHALNGLRGMPPRGGFTNLTDEEVKAGVDYMVRAAGGWKD